MARATLIAGNWKLNPGRAEGRRLLEAIVDGVRSRELGRRRVAIFPPLPFLGEFSGRVDSAVELGVQDCAIEPFGAYTGAVNAPLVREFGASMVLIGHSERRHHFGETDECCRAKLRAALDGGLTPVLCVGETEPERDAGETFDVVGRQLTVASSGVDADEDLIIAYEPVWAIGTGRTATPQMAAEVHRFIRNRLAESLPGAEQRTLILYGGSVKPANAADLLSEEDIDGALVGGASLDAASFLAILDARD